MSDPYESDMDMCDRYQREWDNAEARCTAKDLLIADLRGALKVLAEPLAGYCSRTGRKIADAALSSTPEGVAKEVLWILNHSYSLNDAESINGDYNKRRDALKAKLGGGGK